MEETAGSESYEYGLPPRTEWLIAIVSCVLAYFIVKGLY